MVSFGKGPLKPRLEAAIRSLNAQIHRLDYEHQRIMERDRQIFGKIVDAYTRHDMTHATMYANELAEIRKMAKMLMQSRLALEQIVMRLSTVTEIGELVVTLTPAMSVIKTIRAGISKVLPEAERELSEIGNLINNIIIDAGQWGTLSITFEAANDEAQKILAEAAAVAEQRMSEHFPSLPTGLRSDEESKV